MMASQALEEASSAVRDSEGRRPNRYRLTALALEAFEVASLEELHQKLEPFLGGTAVADGSCHRRRRRDVARWGIRGWSPHGRGPAGPGARGVSTP